jgi:hypothetical protein
LFLLPADWDPLRAGFLLRILWCSQSGNHQETNLAKFGYTLDMKVEKNRILLCFWQPTETNDWNLVIRKKKFFEIWQFWVIFSLKNPFYWLESYFSGRNLTKIRQWKKCWFRALGNYHGIM